MSRGGLRRSQPRAREGDGSILPIYAGQAHSPHRVRRLSGVFAARSLATEQQRYVASTRNLTQAATRLTREFRPIQRV